MPDQPGCYALGDITGTSLNSHPRIILTNQVRIPLDHILIRAELPLNRKDQTLIRKDQTLIRADQGHP